MRRKEAKERRKICPGERTICKKIIEDFKRV